MAVTISGGAQIRRGGVFQSTESLTPATSTATQTVSVTTDVSEFTGPTGSFSNFYTLADGVEGQEKMLRYLATGAGGSTASSGDVQVVPANTQDFLSSVTFRRADDWALLRFMNSQWHKIGGTNYEINTTTASQALPITVDHSVLVRATGTDQVFTLADGYEGQRYMISALAGTTVRTVTPSNLHQYTSLNFGDATVRWAELKFAQGSWYVTSSLNLSTTGTDWETEVIAT